MLTATSSVLRTGQILAAQGRMRPIVTVLVAAVVLSACKASPNPSEATWIKAVLGFNTEYSSKDGSVAMRMCPSGRVTAPVVLSPNTLNGIGLLAHDHGFFSLPAQLAAPKPRTVRGDDSVEYEEITIVSPCSTSSLEISYLGRSHRIAWSCTANISDRPEIHALEKELAPYIKDLPPSNCRYR
jgi:hypothetical protein